MGRCPKVPGNKTMGRCPKPRQGLSPWTRNMGDMGKTVRASRSARASDARVLIAVTAIDISLMATIGACGKNISYKCAGRAARTRKKAIFMQ